METRSDKTPREVAFHDALRKLARRERTTGEIREYLESREHPVDIIEETIALLVQRRYLDDRRYAEAFTRLQGSREKGPTVIRQKLKAKGILLGDSEISIIVEAAQGKSDLERAREIVEKRYPDFSTDLKVAQKAYLALVRRGFSYSIAREVVRKRS